MICGCSYFSNSLNFTACKTREQYMCHLNLLYNLRSISYPKCPLECNTLLYKLTHSSNIFPTEDYAKHLLKNNDVINRSSGLNRSFTIEDVSKSVASIRINSLSSKYKIVTEMEAITPVQLISNIGGLLGLFMGMSLLSFTEFFELLIMIISEFYKEFKPFTKNK